MRLKSFSNSNNLLLIINFIFMKWRTWVVLSSFTILFFFIFLRKHYVELESEKLESWLILYYFYYFLFFLSWTCQSRKQFESSLPFLFFFIIYIYYFFILFSNSVVLIYLFLFYFYFLVIFVFLLFFVIEKFKKNYLFIFYFFYFFILFYYRIFNLKDYPDKIECWQLPLFT